MNARVFSESESRKLDFIECYTHLYRTTRLNRRDCLRKAIVSSAKRFYAPIEYAYRYVSLLERNRPIPCKGLTEMMYNDIFKGYMELRREYPELPKIELISRVVYSEAPRFYISFKTAKDYLYYHDVKIKGKKMKKIL